MIFRDILTITSFVTVIVTFILGLLAKKSTFIENKMIPLQNLIVGIVISIIYYYITRDIEATIVICGIGTGGVYDLGKSIKELFVRKTDNESEG